MKYIFKIFLIPASIFCFHALAAQTKKSVELSLISQRSVNNALITIREVFRIDKDSVRSEVYKDEKLFTKTTTPNRTGEFTYTILDLDSAAWKNIAYQSTIIKNCDTARGLSVNYIDGGTQSNFWIMRTGNCYPENIKPFVKKVFGLFRQD